MDWCVVGVADDPVERDPEGIVDVVPPTEEDVNALGTALERERERKNNHSDVD